MKKASTAKVFLRHGDKTGSGAVPIDARAVQNLLAKIATTLKATKLHKDLRYQLKAIQKMAVYVLARSTDEKQRAAALDAAIYSSAVAQDVERGDVTSAALDGFWAGEAHEAMFLGPWADIGERQRMARLQRQGKELRERTARLAVVAGALDEYRKLPRRVYLPVVHVNEALRLTGLPEFPSDDALRRFRSDHGLNRAGGARKM